jgi:phosphoribosyl-ATP pyrophosphohydrolase/phosphoribosyl-AMP cyclohydrolase
VKSLHERIDWTKCNGLVPAIVQDSITGRVLMLGYMDSDALTETLASAWVTFFSRSRQQQWTKGETSGNRLKLGRIELDCDGDTLLVSATPSGPTCHLGTATCFDRESASRGFGFIGELEGIIGDWRQRPDGYTARLMQEGERRIAQKVGEEGVEVALAGVTRDRQDLLDEGADLVYHLLALLHHEDLNFEDLAKNLEKRHRRA